MIRLLVRLAVLPVRLAAFALRVAVTPLRLIRGRRPRVRLPRLRLLR